MKTLNLVQGSPEWLAHRAQHFNASDAPAMLGVSTNKPRRELLREVHSGVAREFSDYVQEKVIDPGHVYEANARDLAEKIIGEELFPCVGVSDDGLFSASFDGLTLMGDTAFEHKRLNEDLRGLIDGDLLPEMYRVQMEHQCMVSGAERVLFMASQWNGDELVEERHAWYTPDPQLRSRILAGWSQFQADLDSYEPGPEAAPAPTGRAPDQLPALRIELTGMVTESNLEEFKTTAIAVFKGISTDLKTDQDFADADHTVKWCGDIETRLKGAKEHALSQTQSIDKLFKAIDEISAEARTTRLKLEKLVAARKEAIRGEIVDRGRREVTQHYRTINENLGVHALQEPLNLRSDLAAAIKGKRTVISLNDAVDTVVTAAKILASQQAERVRTNVKLLAEKGAGFETLFADSVALCAGKSAEDLGNLISTRIAQHQQAEADRLEADRARIRQEELDRIERENAAAADAAAAVKPEPPAEPLPAPAATTSTVWTPAPAPAQGGKPSASVATIKLGDFNLLIAPLTVTAEGLAKLGCNPQPQPRTAKVYRIQDLAVACETLQRIIANAPARAQRAADEKKAA